MMKINQTGLAPVIMVVTLIGIGLIAATATYFALNLTQKPSVQEAPKIAAPENPVPSPSITQTISIQEVKAANEESLLSMQGVEKVEVGEDDGKPCVIVFTFEKTDDLENLENNGLGGYKVKVLDSSQTN